MFVIFESGCLTVYAVYITGQVLLYMQYVLLFFGLT